MAESYAVIGPPILRGDADEEPPCRRIDNPPERLRVPGIDPEQWLAWKGELRIQAPTEAECRAKIERELARREQMALW